MEFSRRLVWKCALVSLVVAIIAVILSVVILIYGPIEYIGQRVLGIRHPINSFTWWYPPLDGQVGKLEGDIVAIQSGSPVGVTQYDIVSINDIGCAVTARDNFELPFWVSRLKVDQPAEKYTSTRGFGVPFVCVTQHWRPREDGPDAAFYLQAAREPSPSWHHVRWRLWHPIGWVLNVAVFFATIFFLAIISTGLFRCIRRWGLGDCMERCKCGYCLDGISSACPECGASRRG